MRSPRNASASPIRAGVWPRRGLFRANARTSLRVARALRFAGFDGAGRRWLRPTRAASSSASSRANREPSISRFSTGSRAATLSTASRRIASSCAHRRTSSSMAPEPERSRIPAPLADRRARGLAGARSWGVPRPGAMRSRPTSLRRYVDDGARVAAGSCRSWSHTACQHCGSSKYERCVAPANSTASAPST
jgi:hypothetical protein